MTHREHPAIATYLFEQARDILLVLDAADGRIIDANQSAAQAYGYTLSELLERTIFDLRADDRSVVSKQMEHAGADGMLFQTVHRRSDGSMFPVEVNSRGHAVDGRRMLLSVVRDISERKRLEAEREALIETREKALALRDEFLVIASHELRTPVANVSLQLQQLCRFLERAGSDPKVSAKATASLAEVSRLTLLINTLLDAQARAGDISLDRQLVDLGELLHEISTRLRPRAELSGSTLYVDVPALRGHWDRLRLDQVFSNLVINAIKYGRGRPIHIVATPEDGEVEVEVRDEGIGIREEDVSRVFNKFERAVSTEYGGFGLGLYITRQLVDAHGGSIKLSSTLGGGSSFRVTLPLR